MKMMLLFLNTRGVRLSWILNNLKKCWCSVTNFFPSRKMDLLAETVSQNEMRSLFQELL